LEVIAALYYNNRDGVIHACALYQYRMPYLCFNKVIVLAPSNVCYFTNATNLSSCSFMYRICVSLVTAVHALSLLRCVWEWRRYTIQSMMSLWN